VEDSQVGGWWGEDLHGGQDHHHHLHGGQDHHHHLHGGQGRHGS